MKTLSFILLGALICISCSSPADDPKSPNSYERTIIFETSPGETPYGFLPQCRPSHTIEFGLGLDHDFQALNDIQNNELSYAPSIGYFWALNDGNLVFLNRRLGTIIILNPVAGLYYTFSPAFESYIGLHELWVGANDEMFVCLAKVSEPKPDSLTACTPQILPDSTSPDDSHRLSFRLFKYRPLSQGCILDTNFDMAEYDRRPSYIRISPQNHLFIQGWGDTLDRFHSTGVFDENGQFIKNTLAHGETCDGREFYVYSWPRKTLAASFLDWILCNGTTEIIAWPEDKSILKVKMDHAYRNANFKATCDCRFLLYLHNERRSVVSDSSILAVDFPLVKVKDLANNRVEQIDLSECRRDGFDYFSISDVSLNYLGEIYAIAIYFNYNNGRFSDEKIVLYRWRRQNA